MDKFLTYLMDRANRKLTEADVRMMNPLVLAYLGDTLYDLFIRTYLVLKHSTSVHRLHLKAVEYVKAHAQSDSIHKLEEILSDEEKNIVRRGRNAKPGTVPKNADVNEYRWATGFEALLGYLYLLGREDRILDVLSHVLGEKEEAEEN